MQEAYNKHKSVAEASDHLLGSTIAAKYRLDAKIGAGGMGAVYRATRLLIGDEVAIKVLHAVQHDPNAVERFRREAQAAARLKHPNAVNVYDFGITEDGLEYLVMELVEGESLREIVTQKGPLNVSACAEILTQVCAALDEAHRRNIIHRDIKPDNIIVNSAGAEIRVKVLDFGIAKLRDDTTNTLTQAGNVLGTPHYMSPEQCLGEELDGRSDIYSLGIVLFEVLVGRVPFSSPVATAVVIQHVNQAPPSLRSVNASISPAVDEVVLRALAKSRQARPQSARELAEYFDTAVRDGYSAPAKTEPSASHSTDAALASLPTTTLLEIPPRAEKTTAEVRRPRRLMVAAAVAFAAALLLIPGGLVLFSQRQSVRQAENVTNNAVVTPAVITFDRNFAGVLAGKFRMVMKLKRNGRELAGTYFYEPANDTMLHGNFTKEPVRWADKDISLARVDVPIKGTVDDQQNFSIDEFDQKGGTAGTFKGRFISDTELEGKWAKPDGKNSVDFSLKDEGAISSGGNYSVIGKTFVKKSGAVKTHMTYPQLDGLSDQNVQNDVNNRIRALMTKESSGSTDVEGENRAGGFTVEYRSPDLLSVMFDVDVDWTGAAHPMHYSSSYHYDLKRGKPLELRDFFAPGSNYIAVISRLCARQIAEQKRKNGFTDIYEDGEAAVVESLKQKATFYPTKNTLVFVFDPYQVGSYAEGFYVVEIPYSQLSSIINSQGPLGPIAA